MSQQINKLTTAPDKMNFNQWGMPGIRAQLLNIKNNKLEMDFKYEAIMIVFYILNAVSPAFTCAIPFTRYLLDKMQTFIK